MIFYFICIFWYIWMFINLYYSHYHWNPYPWYCLSIQQYYLKTPKTHSVTSVWSCLEQNILVQQSPWYTYTCIPWIKVCQNDSRKWNKSQTYKICSLDPHIRFEPKYKERFFSETPTQTSRCPLVSELLLDFPVTCQMLCIKLNVCIKRTSICYIRSVIYIVFSFISASETLLFLLHFLPFLSFFFKHPSGKEGVTLRSELPCSQACTSMVATDICTVKQSWTDCLTVQTNVWHAFKTGTVNPRTQHDIPEDLNHFLSCMVLCTQHFSGANGVCVH